MTTILKVTDAINSVSRDQSFSSIVIDMVAQTCTVERTSVLTWGSEETAICTSTSYDDFVISGTDFTTLMDALPSGTTSRYEDLAQAIHDFISSQEN